MMMNISSKLSHVSATHKMMIKLFHVAYPCVIFPEAGGSPSFWRLLEPPGWKKTLNVPQRAAKTSKRMLAYAIC